MKELGETITRCRATLTRLSLNFACFGENTPLFSKCGRDIDVLFHQLGGESGFEKLCHLHLNLSQCASCTDEGIRMLSDVLPSSLLLLDLDFSYNRRLTEGSLISLGNQLHNLPHVKYLRLNFMAAEAVADSGVVKLAEGLQRLQWLEHFTLNLHTARNLTCEAPQIVPATPIRTHL
eukprot:3720166-Amphidinium_carterae.1